MGTVNTITSEDQCELDSMLEEYKDRFEGLGKLKDVTVKIHTDPNVTPVVQNFRRLPILM